MKQFEQNRIFLMKKLKTEIFSVESFFSVCPYSVDELRKPNRKTKILEWRHVGMTWLFLCGKSLNQSGMFFRRDHTTARNSVKAVIDSSEGFGLPNLFKLMQQIVEKSGAEIMEMPITLKDVESFVYDRVESSPSSFYMCQRIHDILKQSVLTPVTSAPKKKKVYISGPITGRPTAEYEFNAVEGMLREYGLEVINPFKLNHNHDESWQSYMKVDIIALMNCDYIYMLEDWVLSKGAVIEYQLAKQVGITELNTKLLTELFSNDEQ